MLPAPFIKDLQFFIRRRYADTEPSADNGLFFLYQRLTVFALLAGAFTLGTREIFINGIQCSVDGMKRVNFFKQKNTNRNAHCRESLTFAILRICWNHIASAMVHGS